MPSAAERFSGAARDGNAAASSREPARGLDPSRPPSIAHRVQRPATAARAHRIDEHLWTLQLPLCYPTVASVNAYLIECAEDWVLVDCGSCLAPGWEGLACALAHTSVAPEQIAMLIASHSHADHRGLAAEVLARSGARLAMSRGPHPQIDIFRDPSLPLEQRRQRGRSEGVPEALLDAMVDELPASDRSYPHAEPDLELSIGETLSTRCGAWEVLALPGHSADQIGLWNRERRWLIGADLALPGEASFLEYGTRVDPHADQLASLHHSIALAPELLLSGHGRPRPDPAAFLASCREAVLERLAVVRGALEPTPQTTWALAGRLIDANGSIDQWQRSLAGARSALEHLHAHGLAAGEPDEDGVWRWRRGEDWHRQPEVQPTLGA